MQRQYILSNKENELTTPKSPLRLKINYQAREKFHQRTKSPLRQESLNRRAEIRGMKENVTPPLSTKHTDYNRIYAGESDAHTISKFINENILTPNNHRESSSDLSIVKPISLENRKIEEKRRTEQFSIAPQTGSENIKHANDLSYSKSRHRENSKHMGFISKVGNLQKINSQISSLLSYVYENKTAPKDIKKDQGNSSYKPRYENVSQNAKSYQRRLNGLEKPKEAEPIVSNFDVEERQGKDPSTHKNCRTTSKYEYSTFENANRSPFKILNEDNDKKSIEGKTPVQNKRNVSPKNSTDTQTHNLLENQIGLLKTVKSQHFEESLTPSESTQQLSKITTSNNPDLQFYYDSLKKRDTQIENFKKKIIENEPIAKKGKYFEPEEQILSQKYKAPFKRRNEPRSFERQGKSYCKNQQITPKKDIFITKEEVQIYKDMSKMNQSQNQEISSINRLERIAQRRANLEKEIRQQQNCIKSPFIGSSESETQNKLSYSNEYLQNKNNYQISRLDERRSMPRNSNIDTTLTSKIDQQIQKIKNELRDCNKQKSYLRQKYGSLLSKEDSNFQSKANHSYQAQERIFEEKISPSQRNEVNLPNDKERMFDSENQMRLHSSHSRNETFENCQTQLRQKIYSQNHQQFDRNELNEIKKSEIYEVKLQSSQLQRSPKKIQNLKIQTDYQSEKSEVEKHLSRYVTNQNQTYESFGGQISSQFDKKRATTPKIPKKEFTIQLHKVEIAKPHTTKLGTLLAEKIEIDLNLRNQRQKFMKSTNPNKWNELKSYLQNRYNISKSLKELQQLLTISPEEHNPFSPTSMSSNKLQGQFTKPIFSDSTEEIPLLCSFLSESLEFLDSRLYHKFQGEQLENEHFSFKDLDLNSKGYLSLEDLICFVNLHSGKFYRNRDIIFFVKGLILKQNQMNGQKKQNIECYNSAKGVNEYRLGYEFLWNILTK